MINQFFKFLSLSQSYVLAIQSPSIFAHFEKKKLRCVKNIKIHNEMITSMGNGININEDDNVVFLEDFEVDNSLAFLSTRTLANSHFALKYLSIYNRTLTQKLLFFMLSENIERLTFESVLINPNVQMADILSKIPNVTKFIARSIDLDEDWIVALVQKANKLL